jgi:hypothetical protein
MKRIISTVLACLILTACNNVKNTPLPQDLDKMESIKPALEKLTTQERELRADYIVRHTIGAKMKALFGGTEGPSIPKGMTIGKAIEEQRKFIADQKQEEQKQAALKAALQAKQEAAIKPVREAVTVSGIQKDKAPIWF